MKKHVVLFLMACSGLVANAQNKWNTEPYLTKSLSSAAIKEVFVNTSGGSITVAGVDASQARIEVFVSPNNSNENVTMEEVKQRLEDNYKLEITDANHELHANAKSKGSMNWRKSVSISFKIYVPNLMATNLNTSGGSIHLSDLTGEQNFTTSGGSLHINNLMGKIRGRTSGGSINVANSKQDIDLVTSGGSIKASNCEGTMRLTTSGGSLKLNGLKGNINATTSGGSVVADDVEGSLNTSTSGGSINLTQMACSLDASTSAGSIHAQMKGLGKYVKLNTSAGHIDLEIPSQKGMDLDLRGGRVNASINGSFEGNKERERMQGKLNGGGIPVQADASSGSVNIKYN